MFFCLPCLHEHGTEINGAHFVGGHVKDELCWRAATETLNHNSGAIGPPANAPWNRSLEKSLPAVCATHRLAQDEFVSRVFPSLQPATNRTEPQHPQNDSARMIRFAVPRKFLFNGFKLKTAALHGHAMPFGYV
jgi:hypothetical protein